MSKFNLFFLSNFILIFGCCFASQLQTTLPAHKPSPTLWPALTLRSMAYATAAKSDKRLLRLVAVKPKPGSHSAGSVKTQLRALDENGLVTFRELKCDKANSTSPPRTVRVAAIHPRPAFSAQSDSNNAAPPALTIKIQPASEAAILVQSVTTPGSPQGECVEAIRNKKEDGGALGDLQQVKTFNFELGQNAGSDNLQDKEKAKNEIATGTAGNQSVFTAQSNDFAKMDQAVLKHLKEQLAALKENWFARDFLNVLHHSLPNPYHPAARARYILMSIYAFKNDLMLIIKKHWPYETFHSRQIEAKVAFYLKTDKDLLKGNDLGKSTPEIEAVITELKAYIKQIWEPTWDDKLFYYLCCGPCCCS